MKRTTRSGLIITAAPFWLTWRGPGDGGPERFPHLSTYRPRSGNPEPLSESEALSLWLQSCYNYCTATSEAKDALTLLRNR